MNSLFGNTGSTASEKQQNAGGGFPLKAALALGTAVTVLIAAHFLPGGTRGLSPAIVPEAATLRLPHAPVTNPTLPLNGVQQTRAQEGPPANSGNSLVQGHTQGNVATSAHPGQTTAQPGTTLQDGSGALDPFYAQLWTLQQHSRPEVVTVLHYGDSPTTADLITGDVRALLQERFGDAGHGFNLGAKPWAWYGHRDVDMSDKGWASSQKDATPVGRMKTSVYGLGGAIFVGSTGAQTTYTLRGEPQTAVAVDYLGASGGGVLTVSADDGEVVTIDTAGGGPMRQTVALPVGTKTVKLAVTSGTVKLFGVDFRRGNNGVVYDSLGLNGATTTVLSRTFDTGAWAAEMRAEQPSLIVINYGTNESQFGGLVETLDRELRTAIEKTRAAAPGVPVLVMSPMDRGEGSSSSIHTNPLIPKIVAIQQKVAADEHCAFFNTYEAMGGDGTMARWYAAKPRLITADLIHPTPQGAEYVAQLMVGGLYGGYDRWKAAHNIGVVAVMSPVEAAAKRKAEMEAKKQAAAKAKADAKAAAVHKAKPAEKPAAPAAR